MKITFKPAVPADAKTLTLVQTRTFQDDARQHHRVEGSIPPGSDSVEWQRQMMRQGFYYKILADDAIIGGIILFEMGGGHYNLGRIYLAPEYQNQGIGAQALAFIEQAFPARRWTLDTPEWALRNQHFYEKHGYARVGTQPVEGWDFSLVLYEKQLSP